jgi:hypothetical protein
MGYSRDNRRFREDLDRYRDLLPTTPISLVVRAMPPDCFGPDELRPKLVTAAEASIDWVECFVYGLMRLEGLDWFRLARPR